LALIEAVHPGAFDRADVHKDILAAVFGLDEAVALLAVKPLTVPFIMGAFSFTCECK
jgi:hypothetical protein